MLSNNTVIELSLSFSTLFIQLCPLGKDLCILLTGGEAPHIGCSVLAVPRPSLTGDGSISATSSILNVVGHKDEFLCRLIAEKACKHFNTTVVCTGGFHMDNITSAQISELMSAVKDLTFEHFEQDSE